VNLFLYISGDSLLTA